MILAYFSKNLTNFVVIFRAFGRKTQFVGNLEKIFKKFIRKIAKNALFWDIFKKFNNPCVIFRAFGRKPQIVGKFCEIFDENYIEKLNLHFIFNFIFRKFVTKNRAFGNNTIFLQQFIRYREGGFPPTPMGTRLVRCYCDSLKMTR